MFRYYLFIHGLLPFGTLVDIRTNVRYNSDMEKKSTKDQLLDAAEELFAKEGYHGTSVRSITKRAGAHIASINYHFGSKEELLKEVLERRLIPINQERLKMLELALREAAQEGRPPVILDLVKAFADPLFTRVQASDSMIAFSNIVQISLTQHDSTVGALFLGIMRPVIIAFIDALGLALPEHDSKQLNLKFHFMVGSMLHGMRMLSMTQKPPHSELHSELSAHIDPDTLMDHMYRYIVAGLEAE